MAAALPREDLDLVVSHAAGFFSRHAGSRLFVTGGTGFVGRWLVEAVQRANDTVGSRIDIAVLTRDVQRARSQAPHAFDRPDTRLVRGDVGSFAAAELGAFDLCIHAATDVGDSLRPADPLRVFDSIVAGTRRVLDAARAAGARRFLLTSSGAVYGTQPPQLEHVPESFTGAPDPMSPAAAYGNGKRAAEWLAASYAAQSGGAFGACSARIFALVGPGLPLDGGFAAGNFIRDALAGRPITIQGDGRPLRSYLYTADLTVWLLRLLEAGASGTAYNVGSRHAVSIADLAREVARAAGCGSGVEVLSPPTAAPAPRYVPDNAKALRELGLDEYTPLASALARTLQWSRTTTCQ